MKRVLKVFGIVALVAAVGVVAVGAVAFAQTDNSSSGPFDFSTKFKEALAGILGITVDEYNAAVDKAQQQVLDQAVADGSLTQDQADKMQERLSRSPDDGLFGMGPGRGGRGHGGGGGGGISGVSLRAVAADKLGMTVADLETAMKGGKTIADLAKEKGVDTQAIVDEYASQVQAALKVKVDNGQITQSQADEQLAQAKTRATERITATWENFQPRGPHGESSTGSGTTTDSATATP
jgi:hypothetical protein